MEHGYILTPSRNLSDRSSAEMFSLIFGFWKLLFERPNLHVLIIGLDHAGKTTILEKVKAKFSNAQSLPPERIPPTVGMNLAKIQLKGSRIVFWDLGGQRKMRAIWERYYNEANAVVFVVDSADMERLEEAKKEFLSICENDTLQSVPIMIIANKQDLPGALSPGDIGLHFYPVNEVADRTKVFPVNAIVGQGLEEAIPAIVDEATVNAKSRLP